MEKKYLVFFEVYNNKMHDFVVQHYEHHTKETAIKAARTLKNKHNRGIRNIKVVEMIDGNLGEEILFEDFSATQPSMVNGGQISIFGSDANNKFEYDDWYKQLFELKDYE